jgi:hypothetical protein
MLNQRPGYSRDDPCRRPARHPLTIEKYHHPDHVEPIYPYIVGTTLAVVLPLAVVLSLIGRSTPCDRLILYWAFCLCGRSAFAVVLPLVVVLSLIGRSVPRVIPYWSFCPS